MSRSWHARAIQGTGEAREGTRMTKAELVARMAHDAGLTKRQAEQVVEAFVASIQTALSRGESLSLVGFGRFSVLARAARKGRKPRTGQEIVIPARKTPEIQRGEGVTGGCQVTAPGMRMPTACSMYSPPMPAGGGSDERQGMRAPVTLHLLGARPGSALLSGPNPTYPDPG